MFTTMDGDWAIFWCRQRDQVLHTLAQLGLDIQPKPKRATLFGPGA